MMLKLQVTKEILVEVAKIDRFQGSWPARVGVSTDRLARIEEAAEIQSVGAACRLAGIRVTDADVAGVLRGDPLAPRDAADVRGYLAAMSHAFPGNEHVLTGKDIQRLHAVMMGTVSASAGDGTPWRQVSLHREAFDAEGKAMGCVFATLPPRLVEEKTEEALTWLEFELRSGEQHPVLVISAFLLSFLSISPFERGSGRLTWLLGHHLLKRAGYGSIPYASLSAQIEELRDEYYAAFDKAQTRLWSGEGDITPWLMFFLKVLARHRARVEAKMELERQILDFPPLQRTILEAVREHGTVDAALLLRATGTNRNTLKDNLRRLVSSGVLEKTGIRRGTRYRMATGSHPGPLYTDA